MSFIIKYIKTVIQYSKSYNIKYIKYIKVAIKYSKFCNIKYVYQGSPKMYSKVCNIKYIRVSI